VANPSPGHRADPGHTITLSREGRHVTVSFNGELVADTRNAITLHEKGHAPALYVPRSDIRMDRLVATGHHTTCPFKGEARYWSVVANGETAENALWAYDTPYDEVAGIAGHAAFYPGKVDIAVD
jgi:uncharacterized protein (DUF427 family)